MKKGLVNFSFAHNQFNPLHTLPILESERQALQASGFTHGYRDPAGEFLVKQGSGRDMQVLRKVFTGEKEVWVKIFPRPRKKKKCKGCKNCACKKGEGVQQHVHR